MHHLERTIDYADSIQSATSAAEICEKLLGLSREFGLNQLIAGTVPRPGLTTTQQRNNILLIDWPQSWLRRFVAFNYAYVDPILHNVQTRPGVPFRWCEAAPPPGSEKAAGKMMGEAAEHGLKAGIAVPVVTLEGAPAVLTLGGERMELGGRDAALLHLAGIIAIGRAMQIMGRSKIEYEPLTQRELDIVRWCAEGKTEFEIAVILGLQANTVRNHIVSARQKFGGVNKPALVANAFRAGLIK